METAVALETLLATVSQLVSINLLPSSLQSSRDVSPGQGASRARGTQPPPLTHTHTPPGAVTGGWKARPVLGWGLHVLEPEGRYAHVT